MQMTGGGPGSADPSIWFQTVTPSGSNVDSRQGGHYISGGNRSSYYVLLAYIRKLVIEYFQTASQNTVSLCRLG